MVMKATHTSSVCTKVPGNSPAIMRVKTEAIASTVQRIAVLSRCGRQAGFNVDGNVQRSKLHHTCEAVRASVVPVFAVRQR